MSNELTRLLPCPFCGSEAKRKRILKVNHAYCTRCGVCTGIGLWNERALSPSPEREGRPSRQLLIDALRRVRADLQARGLWDSLDGARDITDLLSGIAPRATEQALNLTEKDLSFCEDCGMYVVSRPSTSEPKEK